MTTALGLALVLAALPALTGAQAPPGVASGAAATLSLADVVRDGLTYRNLGPFRAGSWITDVAVPAAPAAAHLHTFYVAARNGGVWKTTNNGTTFAPVFDATRVSSVGALAVAPSDPNVVWVGTGDNSATRSAYAGDGVYKSADGGATWRRMGLTDVQHVARVVIHPADANTVYVAALGHLFSTNAERGVFRTTDGGRTWSRVLYVNDSTGAADLVMDPRDPRVLYATMYEHRRYAWRLHDGGHGSGVYKSADGGATWQKLGGGLPSGAVGRIGLDVHRADPRIVYAIVENRTPRPPTDEERQQDARRGVPPQERQYGGEVYRSDDAGETWRKVSGATEDLSNKSGYAFNQIRVDPADPSRLFVTGSGLSSSRDGGRTWVDATAALARAGGPADAWVTRVFASPHAAGTAYVAKSRHRDDDFRPLVYRTTDHGATWTAVVSGLPRRPVNVVAEDPVRAGVVFAGTDAGVYVSLDAGARWLPLTGNMPAVPVHDLVVHPRDGDLVVGTYGRGLWVADATPLRELADSVLAVDAPVLATRPRAADGGRARQLSPVRRPAPVHAQ